MSDDHVKASLAKEPRVALSDLTLEEIERVAFLRYGDRHDDRILSLVDEVRRLRAGAPSPRETRLRDDMARAAMQAFVGKAGYVPDGIRDALLGGTATREAVAAALAKDAYDIADAMLAERSRRET